MSVSNVADYMNDHLGGSSGALELLKRLIDLKSGEEKIFYRRLYREIKADQDILKNLLKHLHREKSVLKQVAGSVAEKAGRIKTSLDGMEEGDLGLFESLEVLVLGIQGKKMMWKALAHVQSDYPAWKGVPFVDLQHKADEQILKVERRRDKLAKKVFGP